MRVTVEPSERIWAAELLFQAAMAVAGPRDHKRSVLAVCDSVGETLFTKIVCVSCHVPSLPLNSWMYMENRIRTIRLAV